jgi:hypothetical protein
MSVKANQQTSLVARQLYRKMQQTNAGSTVYYYTAIIN